MQAPVPSQRSPLTKAQSTAARPAGHTRISKKAAKRMLAVSALLAILMLLFAALVTYLVDPLQFYHKPFGYKPIFSSEQRYQNPGLARNYDYDTIIVGTSMTENFLPSQVDKALGGKTLKLSIRGSTADEQYKIARLAIHTGKVKTVLWGIDYFALKTGDQSAAGAFPDYLYDDSRWNDYRYLLNYNLYGPFLQGLTKKLTGGSTPSLEMLYNWNNSVQFGKNVVLKEYRKTEQEEAYFGLNEEPLETVKRNFNANVLSLAKAYPNISFIVYYPPYSVLREAVWERTNEKRYRNQLEMAVWMFRQFDALPNVRVYNFQTAGEWTYDLSLYKDLSHHNQEVNSRIIAAIGADDPRYRMNAANAQTFSDMLEEQVQTLALTEQGDPVSVQVLAGSGEDTQAARESAFSSRVIPGEGEVLVPVKEAAAALGASFDWNQATKTVSLARGAESVSLTVDGTGATADNHAVELPYPARLINGKTHVPLLKLASLLGYAVAAEQPNAWSIRYTLLAQT